MARNDRTDTNSDAPQTDGEQTQPATEGDGAQGEQATEGEAPANGTEPKAKAKRQNRNTYTIPVTIPTELHNIIKAKADEDKTTATQIARKLLADYVSYTLPLVVARAPKRKFASKEEAAKFRKERNAKAKALLAALDSGEVSEETLAKYLAAQGNGAAAAPATPEGEQAATSEPVAATA